MLYFMPNGLPFVNITFLVFDNMKTAFASLGDAFVTLLVVETMLFLSRECANIERRFGGCLLLIIKLVFYLYHTFYYHCITLEGHL